MADLRAFICGLYRRGLSTKRTGSLTGTTRGAIQAASLAVAMLGQALALTRGLISKHAIK